MTRPGSALLGRAAAAGPNLFMDGLYVIPTSKPAGKVSAQDDVRGYKSLARAERVFRRLKGGRLMSIRGKYEES
ncbi:MAG: hypothetical protein ABSG91_13085 [Syntrophobacteraceae bacterium]